MQVGVWLGFPQDGDQQKDNGSIPQRKSNLLGDQEKDGTTQQRKPKEATAQQRNLLSAPQQKDCTTPQRKSNIFGAHPKIEITQQRKTNLFTRYLSSPSHNNSNTNSTFYRSLEINAVVSTPPQTRKKWRNATTNKTTKVRKISAQMIPDLLNVHRLKSGHRGRSDSVGNLSLAASDGELESRDDDYLGKGTGLDLTGNLPQQENVGRVSSWAVGFERLLQDQLGLECFTLFLKKEFSEENIMFWVACEQLGKMKDKTTLEKHAQEIYIKFLSPKATSPVNLDSQCRELVEEAIKNPTPEMFRTQQQQIFKLMKYDSYSRFLKSKMYQDCVIAEMGGQKLPFAAKNSPKNTQDPAKLSADKDKERKRSWLPFPNFRTSRQAQN